MKRLKSYIGLALVGLIEYAMPLRFVEAKGGIFNNPIFGIVLTVAIVVASVYFPPLTAAISSVEASVDAAVGISGFAAGVADAYTFVSFATAFQCLGGDDNFRYSGCGGSGGGDNGSSNTSSQTAAQNEQAAINANTITIQSQGGGPQCPTGSTYVPELQPPNQCLPNNYISCASAGFPDLVCPNNQQCTSDGQCQAQVNGSNCKAGYNQTCQSAANSCGMTGQGVQMCDGSCPAPVPSDSACVPPSIQLSEVPSLVNSGSNCTVDWQVTNATACTLSSDVADASLPMNAALPSGSYQSPALHVQTTYTLSCKNGKVTTNSASVICHLNPQFQEN